MRYDIRTLTELREAVNECDAGDRLTLFFPDSETVRFRVFGRDDKLQWEWCDRWGNNDEDKVRINRTGKSKA